MSWALPFASSIVAATDSGKMRECSPRRSSTGHFTRAQAPQKSRPELNGIVRITLAIFGS